MRLTLFAGEEKKFFGGMQTHMSYLVEFFSRKEALDYIVYRYPEIVIYSCMQNGKKRVDNISDLIEIIEYSTVCFFNDGFWIDLWDDLRLKLSNAMFIFRTGGNEFVKAPYKDNSLSLSACQHLWAEAINNCMNFVISNSRFTTCRLLNQGVEESKILLVRGGIDIEQCKENHENWQMLRQQFDKKYNTQNKQIFAIVSRFEPFKGILEILAAFPKCGSDSEYFILLVGGGSEKKKIQEFCKNHFGISEYCILNETENSTAIKYIALSDYYINCSHLYEKKSGEERYIHTETMGRSLYEAIYQYVPIIATNVGGTGELFHEFEQIGELLEDTLDDKMHMLKLILSHQTQLYSKGSRYVTYGWNYIMHNIYGALFNSVLNRTDKKIALCLDIDGTIYHPIFSEMENRINLINILSLHEDCEIIINSATNFVEIQERYPVFNEYKDRIVIISNCGKHLYFHGEKDLFWDNYVGSILGIQKHIVELVLEKLEVYGINVTSFKYIDELYVNMKITGDAEPYVIKNINKELDETEYMITANNGNVKLISKVVNKASPINYLKAMNQSIDYWVGAGNNVLDLLFLDLCDCAYAVNLQSEACRQVCITDMKSMSQFIELIKDEVGDYLSKWKKRNY